MEKPYCACATPPGTSGIAVIRMAGEGSAAIMDRVFRIRRAAEKVQTVSEMAGYTVAYGVLMDPASETIVDEVMVTRFVAPHSYTGEEAIEISCHGGTTVRQEILRVLQENGARMAGPGEFTKRAFLAGKIDLSQAEAVMDVISADSDLALRAAQSQLQGSLKNEIAKISEALYSALAVMEMWIDEPDDEDAQRALLANAEAISAARKKVSELIDTYRQGRILKERMRVVICGVPNSGKSSLLNYLSGYNRAIVTDLPGTTRDTLEVQTSIQGVPVTLIDTAGIRETDDRIEAMGVDRAGDAMSEADLVFWLVFPEEQDLTEQETMIDKLMQIQSATRIGLLISKSDLVDEDTSKDQAVKIEARIAAKGYTRKMDFIGRISASSGEGIREMEDFIRQTYDEMGSAQAQGMLLTNQRHFELLRSAGEKLDQAVALCQQGESLEAPSLVLRTAMEDLGEITGDSVSDKLVDTIFSRFCVGK